MIKIKNECPLCKTSTTVIDDVIHPDFWTSLYHCKSCLHSFSDSIPEDVLKRFYSSRYRKVRKEGPTKAYEDRMLERAKAQVEFILNSDLDLNQTLNILEIGSGAGFLISQFKEHTRNLFFQEWDENFASITRSKGASEVKKLEGKKFDLILLSHVLEHYSQPADSLDQLVNSLNENGFVFVELPFEPQQFIQSKLFKSGSGHLHHFSQESALSFFKHFNNLELISFATANKPFKEYFKDKDIDHNNFENDYENFHLNKINMRFLLKKNSTSREGKRLNLDPKIDLPELITNIMFNATKKYKDSNASHNIRKNSLIASMSELKELNNTALTENATLKNEISKLKKENNLLRRSFKAQMKAIKSEFLRRLRF